MSDEEKVNAPVTGSPEASAAGSGTVVRKAKRWPIVISAIAVVAIAVLVAFLHWHEEPTFCNVFCHQPMDRYVEGYYSDDVSMEAAVHEQNGVTCLGCHWTQAKMMDLVNEVVVWATDGFTDPLPDETGIANEEFCGKCHDGVTAPTKESATADMPYDPHNIPADVAMHQTAGADGGEIICSDCHKAHKASTMMCAQCHADSFTTENGLVPEGWVVPEGAIDVLSMAAAAAAEEPADDASADAASADVSAVADGTYTGEAKGMESTIKVTVTVAGGKITDLQAEGQETEGIGSKALDELPGTITSAGTIDGVDGVAGATITSNAIFDATKAALASAGGASSDAAASDGAADVSAIADGTYEGTGKGMGGDVPVSVTVAGGKITVVTVGDNSETQGIGTNAIDQLPAKIVEANGTAGVDTVSGATITSKAIIAAVDEALANA